MSIEIAKRKAELEELDTRRAAIQQEIAALEKTGEVPVMRMETFRKLEPSAQSAYCVDVRAGRAKLID